jgi:signal transduction histidine kinase
MNVLILNQFVPSDTPLFRIGIYLGALARGIWEDETAFTALFEACSSVERLMRFKAMFCQE